MEFDHGVEDVNKSTYENIKEKYKEAQIKMPEIIFWNVNARHIHFPTTDKDNVKLISGYSNHILQNILNDNTTTAMELMKETLEKYKQTSNSYLA